jgi:hypothetical protein
VTGTTSSIGLNKGESILQEDNTFFENVRRFTVIVTKRTKENVNDK